MLVTAAVACWKFFFNDLSCLLTAEDSSRSTSSGRTTEINWFENIFVLRSARWVEKLQEREKNLQRGIKNKLLSALQAWSEIKILPFYAIHSSRLLHSFTKHITAHKSLSLQTTTLYHIHFSSLSLQFQRLQIVNYFNNC